VKSEVDFIIIGAQKAGTTSLFEYLRRHPELVLPPGKELPFFSHEEIRGQGWDGYLRKAFAFADPDLKWGTATPQYMVGGLWEEPNPTPRGEAYDERTVPLRIYEQAPGARLIAILRDPAERARSHHQMASMNQIDGRPFAQAIDELLDQDALRDARREPRETTGYVSWGEYGRILAGYFSVFPREQILVVFTSELESEPEALLRRVFEFIGVAGDFVPDNLGARYRAGGAERRFSWLGTHSRLNPWALQRALTRQRMAKRLWHALPEAWRRQVDRAFASVTYRMDLWNRRSSTEPVDSDNATLERLHEHYAHDVQELAALLGRRPPWAWAAETSLSERR
jgi:hypothetical protein